MLIGNVCSCKYIFKKIDMTSMNKAYKSISSKEDVEIMT